MMVGCLGIIASAVAIAEPCQPPHVEIHVVDDPEGYMKAVHARLEHDRDRGISRNTSQLESSAHIDYMITADSSDVLLRYLAELARATPKLELGSKYRVVIEKRGTNVPGRDAYTAIVIRAAVELDERGFGPATVKRWMNKWWYVAVTPTAEGKRTLKQALAHAKGRHIVALLDGEVVTEAVPVVGTANDGELPLFPIVPSKRAGADAFAAALRRCERR
jgi:hypothetical protein